MFDQIRDFPSNPLVIVFIFIFIFYVCIVFHAQPMRVASRNSLCAARGRDKRENVYIFCQIVPNRPKSC